MSELRGDLLEGDGAGGEALVLSALDERRRGREEGAGRDEDVVGLVRGRAQGRRLGDRHARREQCLRGGDQVTV